MADLLPFDDRDGVIWYDGALVPWRDAKIHVLSHALHYASCVFEGERVYDGRIFKVEEHTQRLIDSARALDFELPYSCDELVDASNQVVKELGIGDGYVRPVAWRGPEMMGVSAQSSKIHVAIAVWPWPPYFGEEARQRGIKLQTAKWRRPSPETAPVKAKAAGLYMICTLCKHDAEKRGYNDALMLDWRGQIAEATGANVFLVQEGRLHTPTPDCFLDGITRRTVIGLAKDLGYEVIERAILPDELDKTDEIFITGTAVEVTPVAEIDDRKFKVGEITRSLVTAYDNLVNRRDGRTAHASIAAAE